MLLPRLIHPTAVIGGAPEHRDNDGAFFYQPIVHPSARVNAYVTIDSGVARPTIVGKDVFLMAKCHIAHDCRIGDGCEVATGAVLGGWVELDRNVKVGLNATIRPRVKIGAGARIGAGAVVTKDVPAGEVWVGCPARNIDEHQSPDPLWLEWLEARDAARV